MPLRGLRRMESLAGRPPRRQTRRIRLALLVSLLLHYAIGVILLVTIPGEEKPELLPPPSAVTMLFESGRKNGPTLPNPDLQASPTQPAVPPSPPLRPLPLPTPPLLPVTPPPPQPPAPQPPAPAAPPAPPVETTQPPLPPAEEAPLPTPPAPPMPLAVRPPPKPPAPPKQPAFPTPMNYSFGTPFRAPLSPAQPRHAPHIPGTIDMSLGPAAKGSADTTPYADQDEEAEGADWRNALSRWVSEHAYYPEQARREGEEGDAKVHVVVQPNGHVTMVELIGKSGSMWLDLALQALFRDQNIPPLPVGTKESVNFDFTMHYVLIRSR